MENSWKRNHAVIYGTLKFLSTKRRGEWILKPYTQSEWELLIF
jgi:hypothetical protein